MREQIERYVKGLGEELEKVNWKDERIYAAYCAQIYYFVRQSTRLLALGAGRMTLEDEDGHLRYLKHLQEEKNHELLALRDAAALGYDVHDIPELPALKGFYQQQFYYIMNETPWAFLGYVLVLEGMAVHKAMWVHDQAVKFHGPKCGSFLKVHGEEDEDHFPKALQQLETRSEQEKKAILASAEMSFFLHRQMLRDLPDAVAGMKVPAKKKAA